MGFSAPAGYNRGASWESRMRILHIVLIAVLAGITLVFAIQNLESVTVAFLGLRASTPLWLLIVVVYFLGMATGGSLVAAVRYALRGATTRPE